jgi:hypothetical protein
MEQYQFDVQNTYDQVAEAYADFYFHEFDHQPLNEDDCRLLR